MDVTAPPTVVTTTSLTPAVPEGAAAVRDVPDPFTTTLVAAAPPTVKVAPVKFVPVIVIAVPDVNGPDDGLTLAIVGAATYVNVMACDVDPPTVVTTIVFAPAVPTGVTALMDVALSTTTPVAATPPIVTLVAPVKFVPVMVMAVPAVNGPDDGLTLAMVGAATYVNAPVDVSTPPTVVTTTSFTPAIPTGAAAVNDVPEPFTTTPVAAAPPTVTEAPVKFVPVIVIAVPAANGPDDGLTLAIVGTAKYVNVLLAVIVPPAVRTWTDLLPAVPAGVVA